MAYDPTTKLLTSVTDTGIGSSNNVTSWVYDSVDRPVTETRPGGTQLHFVLDDKTDRRLTLQFPNLSPNPGDIGYALRQQRQHHGDHPQWADHHDQLRCAEPALGADLAERGDDQLVLRRPRLREPDPLQQRQPGRPRLHARCGRATSPRRASTAQTFTYGYDDLSRLSSASVMGTSYAWTYDKAGNRTQQMAGGVTHQLHV